eukprot:3401462-Prymnesium_polylepis.1
MSFSQPGPRLTRHREVREALTILAERGGCYPISLLPFYFAPCRAPPANGCPSRHREVREALTILAERG